MFKNLSRDNLIGDELKNHLVYTFVNNEIKLEEESLNTFMKDII